MPEPNMIQPHKTKVEKFSVGACENLAVLLAVLLLPRLRNARHPLFHPGPHLLRGTRELRVLATTLNIKHNFLRNLLIFNLSLSDLWLSLIAMPVTLTEIKVMVILLVTRSSWLNCA